MAEYSFLDNFMLMKKTDEYMLGRIKWKFNKYKISNNYTFFFEELSPSIQAYLRTSIDEHLSGIPVIFFTKPSNEWTLLCTKQVLGYTDQKIFRINLQDIAVISPFLIRKPKGEWDELTVLDKQEKSYVFHTYDGYAHNALHNVLLMCCRLVD
jgi:hypothetical protein